MSAHTPGPWEVGSDFVGPLKVMTVKDRQVIAHVGGSKFVSVEANARLIAAAPDLLAALKSMMDGAYGNPAFPDENAFVEAEAAAAIAKAEGRS